MEADYVGDRTYVYEYDVAGNRTRQETTIGITTTITDWTYNNANQMSTMKIGANPTVNMTYDDNGNLTDDGVLTYTWDNANRLKTLNNGSYNTHFAYDGNGDRHQQDVGGTVTDYLLDVQPELALVLRETVSSDTTHYIHSPMGVHSAYDDTDWTEMLNDGLGSIRVQVDAMGDISADQTYDPYGQVIDDNGTWIGSFGYAGEQTDESGLGYNRARYYHPQMGAFASLDPFEGVASVPMSMNGYSYAHNDPVNNTDPSGAVLDLGLGGLVGAGILVWEAVKAVGIAILSAVASITLTKIALVALLLIIIAIAAVATILAVVDVGNKIICLLSGNCVVEVSKAEIAEVEKEIEEDAPTIEDSKVDTEEVPNDNGKTDKDKKDKRKGGPRFEDVEPWWWLYWLLEQENEKKEPKKHIALGINDHPETDSPLLLPFKRNLNEALRPDATAYTFDEWQEAGLSDTIRFPASFEQASQNAIEIHFNLEGFSPSDPIDFANERGNKGKFENRPPGHLITGVELFQVIDSESLCGKTSFYQNGSTDVGTKIPRRTICSRSGELKK